MSQNISKTYWASSFFISHNSSHKTKDNGGDDDVIDKINFSKK